MDGKIAEPLPLLKRRLLNQDLSEIFGRMIQQEATWIGLRVNLINHFIMIIQV